MTFGQSLDGEKLKVNLFLEPAETPSSAHVRPSMLELLRHVRMLCQSSCCTDRGHKHSNGLSVVQLWIAACTDSAPASEPVPQSVSPSRAYEDPARASLSRDNGEPMADETSASGSHYPDNLLTAISNSLSDSEEVSSPPAVAAVLLHSAAGEREAKAVPPGNISSAQPSDAADLLPSAAGPSSRACPAAAVLSTLTWSPCCETT